jgi:hypothetical protein
MRFRNSETLIVPATPDVIRGIRAPSTLGVAPGATHEISLNMSARFFSLEQARSPPRANTGAFGEAVEESNIDGRTGYSADSAP